jgi:hypothetical protein
MSTSPELKTCRKGLHQYPTDKKRCPGCHADTKRNWRFKNLERSRENTRKWRMENHVDMNLVLLK